MWRGRDRCAQTPKAVAATAPLLNVAGIPTGSNPVVAQPKRRNQMGLLAPLSRPLGERATGGESGKNAQTQL